MTALAAARAAAFLTSVSDSFLQLLFFSLFVLGLGEDGERTIREATVANSVLDGEGERSASLLPSLGTFCNMMARTLQSRATALTGRAYR